MLVVVESLRIEETLRTELRRIGTVLTSGQVPGDDFIPVLRVLRSYLAFARQVAEIAPRFVAEETVASACVELRQHFDMLSYHPQISADLKRQLEETVAELPAEVAGLKGYRFSQWVGFPHALAWQRLLADVVGKELRVLEVGSFEGRSACWLLQNVLTHPASRVVCVDLFHSDYEGSFLHNIQATGSADKVEVKKGMSADVMSALPRDSFDVIYLDASSSAPDELVDCVLAARLLKPGGLLICDDYGGGSDWEPGVTTGVDSFLACFGKHFSVVESDFQIALRKRGP